MEDLISVIIPVYTYQPYLQESIKSILEQTYNNLEIIVISDDKSDEVNKMICLLNDKRLKLIIGPGNGLPAALNMGIREATGKFIARMDADDIALKDKYFKQIDFLIKNELDICGTNIKTIDSTNYVIKFPEFNREIQYYTLFGSPVAHPSVLGKASIFKEFTYNESFSSVEDYELWARMAKAGSRFGNLQESLLLYRVHSAQASKNGEQIKNSITVATDYAEFLFKNKVDEVFIRTGFGFYSSYSHKDASLFLETLSKYAQICEVSMDNFERQVLSIYSRITVYSFNVLIGYYKFAKQNRLNINLKFLFYLLFKCFYKKTLPPTALSFLKKIYK